MMKPARRHIRLTFVTTGESAIAELLDDEAPKVCQTVWESLPQESGTLHGQFSGAEVFILIDPLKTPAENRTQIPLPGEILYFFDPGGGVQSPNPTGEICLVYGRGVILKEWEGVPTHASLFARIPGDWKYDWADFADACRRARREGPQRLRIERA
jgi:hypothetical protein